jgi:hypothetical protein
MQYPPPGNVFLSFPPPPNGPHLPAHGSQSWEMGSDDFLHPGSSQPAGITRAPYFPSMGFPHGSNYINVINFESPTRPNQTKKRKRVGGAAPSRKCKCKHSLLYEKVY